MGDKKLDLLVWLWSRNKATIIPVEGPTITKSKKGAAGPEFNKEHAHCLFFDMKEIVREFVPPNTTFNSDFYCDILRHLWENVWEKDRNFSATTTGSFPIMRPSTCPWKP
jgi:hypothetical protein